MNNKICVIGDSHHISFTGIGIFVCHHLGPKLAYNIHNQNSQIQTIIKSEQANDIIFCFGEIDCRYHIYNIHKKQNIPLIDVIENVVDRYTLYISQLNDITKYIVNIVPTGTQTNIYNIEFFSDIEQRTQITLEFNCKLKEYCQLRNIIFLDVYDQLIDENGYKLKKLVTDDVHITNEFGKLIQQKYFM